MVQLTVVEQKHIKTTFQYTTKIDQLVVVILYTTKFSEKEFGQPLESVRRL